MNCTTQHPTQKLFKGGKERQNGIHIEFPLRLVIILAVGLIVAFSVMSMSKQILKDSSDDLDTLQEVKIGDQMNEVGSLSAGEIAKLAHKCIEAKKESPGIATCYAIRADDPLPTNTAIDSAWSSMEYHGTVNVHDCSGSENALFMDYIIPAQANITCR